jgi:hypothetical protein
VFREGGEKKMILYHGDYITKPCIEGLRIKYEILCSTGGMI